MKRLRVGIVIAACALAAHVQNVDADDMISHEDSVYDCYMGQYEEPKGRAEVLAVLQMCDGVDYLEEYLDMIEGQDEKQYVLDFGSDLLHLTVDINYKGYYGDYEMKEALRAVLGIIIIVFIILLIIGGLSCLISMIEAGSFSLDGCRYYVGNESFICEEKQDGRFID